MREGKLAYRKDDEISSGIYKMIELPNDRVRLEIQLSEEGIEFAEEGGNYFHLLQRIRNELESKNIILLCNGTSLDVYPSAMQLDMGGGERAYRLKMGTHSNISDVVQTMEYDRDRYIESTVKRQTEFYERWVLSKKKSEIRKPRYTANLITENNNDHVFFWGHQPNQDGSIGKSCLSQWWPCIFEKEGIKYTSAEQWMMAEKARVFVDRPILEKILLTDDPREAKKLGRKVSFFDEDVWRERSYDIVFEGNLLKFSQNRELKEYLISTGEAVLVEASPYDKIWGIGMKWGDEGIENPKNWHGQNLLGFALMEVRDLLKEQDRGLFK